MFTGIVQKVGRLKNLTRKGKGFELEVLVDENWGDLQIGESIAVNGVCLTLTRFSSDSIIFDVSPETATKSTLSRLPANSLLNLERL